MFSGPLERTALSVGIGVVVGLTDAAGFFYTARFFLASTTSGKRVIAGFAEAARMILLIAVVLLLWHLKFVPVLWLLCSALVASLAGKLFLISKRLRA
jgi:hypothetical protein